MQRTCYYSDKNCCFAMYTALQSRYPCKETNVKPFDKWSHNFLSTQLASDPNSERGCKNFHLHMLMKR